MNNKSRAKVPSFSLKQRLFLLLKGIFNFSIQTDATNGELIMLSRLASKKNGGVIVEIGSYLGASSLVLAKSNRKGSLYCIDTWQNDAMSEGRWDTMSEFDNNVRGCNNIVKLRMLSSEAGEKVPKEIDMIFIDGDHNYNGVKTDVDIYFPKLKSGGIIAMHDIGWAEGVNRVIREDISPFVFQSGTLPNMYWAIKK